MNTLIHYSRRAALRLIAGATAALAIPGQVWAFVVGQFRTRTIEDTSISFDATTGTVRVGGKPQPYALIVDGMVQTPARLDYKALRSFPQHAQTSDFHCVEGWSVLDVQWSGIRPVDIIALAQPRKEATHVIFHALGTTSGVGDLDHYIECLPLEDLQNDKLQYLLALDYHGSPMPDERGAPLRLVCPFDLGYKGIKYLTRMEFTDTPRDGWWTVANDIYPRHAPVQPERLRKPDPRS